MSLSPDRQLTPVDLHNQTLQLFEALANHTRDGVAIFSPTGELHAWNAAAVAITGWSFADAKLQDLSAVLRASGLTEMRAGKWVELRHVAVHSGAETFTLTLFTDTTPNVRLRDTRDQLRALGLIDELTNLPGRELALVHIEHAIALAKRDKRSVGLLGLKLDRFPELRAAARRETVDETLRQFAKRLSAFVRASDVPVRLSEASFLVVLSALTTSNDAAVVAVRLLLALAEPFDVVGDLRTLHCSIGVAESPRDGDEATALLGAALSAADRAQALGGGQYCIATQPGARD